MFFKGKVLLGIGENCIEMKFKDQIQHERYFLLVYVISGSLIVGHVSPASGPLFVEVTSEAVNYSMANHFKE